MWNPHAAQTPTPRRFLLPSKRPASSQHTQTPTPTPALALAPQASQFQSTPRFGSSSVPRPGRGRALSIEEVDEEREHDSSGASTTGSAEDGDEDGDVHRAGGRKVREVEADSISSASSPGGSVSSSDGTWRSRREGDAEEGHVDRGTSSPSCWRERRAKRRRVLSISSPGGSCFSSAEEGGVLDGAEDFARETCVVEGGYASLCEEEERRVDEEDDDEEEEEEGEAIRDDKQQQQQPVFRPPPRFKLPEVVDDEARGRGDILPLAFSPQRPRRGRAYPAGGLAAQLQSCLSEVRGWDGESRPTARMVVAELRPGPLMYLARGASDDTGREDGGESGRAKAYILAGEGKLTGLGPRAVVRIGSVVVLEEPAWEVDLLGESWTVVCNWSVEG